MATQQELVDTAVKVADGWRLRGRWADGVALLHGVQPAARELGATAGARVLVALARMLNDQSMFAGVRQVQERAAVLDEALALAQQADDPALLGEAWAVRGMALHTDFLAERGTEPAGELDCFQRGLQLRRKAGDERGVAESLFQVGLVHQVIRDDSAAALPWFEEACARPQGCGPGADVVCDSPYRLLPAARGRPGRRPRWPGGVAAVARAGWVLTRMVTPSATRSRMSCHMVWRLRGSRPVVGSSRKISRGRPIRVIAMSRRRFMPPE